MNKYREAPIYVIEGTSFLVDIDRQVLRQTNDQDNEISFINQMQDHGNFYRLLYDRDEHNAAEDLFDSNRIVVIDIPQMTALDPEGMAEKYGVPIAELTGKPDFDVIVNPELLQARLAGQLPTIEIANQLFTLDLRLREFWLIQDPFITISLRSFDLSRDGNHYEAAYNPVLKQVVQLDPHLTEFPDGVIKIRLPNEIGLDPVSVARQYGIDEKEFLRRYPIQSGLKAEIIPLSETDVPAMIRRNREQLQKEHQEIKGRTRVRHRPHF
jgi:hypothetical protein